MARGTSKTEPKCTRRTAGHSDSDEQRAMGSGSEAEWVALSELAPWKRNPRKNQPVDDVARSIIAFGWGSPILVRGEDLRIIAGHTRAKAAERLATLWRRARPREREDWHPDAIRTKNTGEVVIRRKHGLTDAQCDALALADNKLGEKADWDEHLSEVLASLETDGLLADLGFDDRELDKLLGSDMTSDVAADTFSASLKFQVLVVCKDEMHQGDVLAQLEAMGLECKPLIT